jgi:ribosomal protein L24
MAITNGDFVKINAGKLKGEIGKITGVKSKSIFYVRVCSMTITVEEKYLTLV